MQQQRVQTLLGYDIFAGPMDELVGEIVTLVRSGQPASGWLACMNPHSYAVACDDPVFRDALSQSRWLVPDGVGILWASYLAKVSFHERLPGPDIFSAVSAAMNHQGAFTVMFLGSTEDTLEKISSRYRADYPNVSLVSTFSPPFSEAFTDDDVKAMREAVRQAQPDLLWCGLTAPKQEVLLTQLGPDCGYRFAAAIGAAFDFYAGNVKRSSLVFRKLGIEWLPRLMREPRRLWRRTFASAPRFLWHVLTRQLLSLGASNRQ